MTTSNKKPWRTYTMNIVQDIINKNFDKDELRILQMIKEKIAHKDIIETIGPQNAARVGNTCSKFYRLTETHIIWGDKGSDKKALFIDIAQDLDFSGQVICVAPGSCTHEGEFNDCSECPSSEPITATEIENYYNTPRPPSPALQEASNDLIKHVLKGLLKVLEQDEKLNLTRSVIDGRLKEIGQSVVDGTLLGLPSSFVEETKAMIEAIEALSKIEKNIKEALNEK